MELRGWEKLEEIIHGQVCTSVVLSSQTAFFFILGRENKRKKQSGYVRLVCTHLDEFTMFQITPFAIFPSQQSDSATYKN